MSCRQTLTELAAGEAGAPPAAAFKLAIESIASRATNKDGGAGAPPFLLDDAADYFVSALRQSLMNALRSSPFKALVPASALHDFILLC
jgi:hypothetical protein